LKNFGLSSQERIKSRKDFQKIYSSGKHVFSHNKNIKALYIIEESKTNAGIKIAAVVFKKAGNSVWRNRLKRLIKESFRLNKHILSDQINEKNIILKIIFSSNLLNKKNNKSIELKTIMPEIVDIMLKIKSEL
jgi:ribonuclease P protein component